MKNLMDDRGISPLVATVILIAITVAAAGSIAVIITRLSVSGTSLPAVSDVTMIYKDNDTATTNYNWNRGYKVADDNAVYIRMHGAAGARQYSPTIDLTLSFAFSYDNRAGGTDLAVSGVARFTSSASTTTESPTVSKNNCKVYTLIASTSPEGYFEVGNIWLLKIVPGDIGITAGSPTGDNYAVYENTSYTIIVATGGKTVGYETTSDYWSDTGTSLG